MDKTRSRSRSPSAPASTFYRVRSPISERPAQTEDKPSASEASKAQLSGSTISSSDITDSGRPLGSSTRAELDASSPGLKAFVAEHFSDRSHPSIAHSTQAKTKRSHRDSPKASRFCGPRRPFQSLPSLNYHSDSQVRDDPEAPFIEQIMDARSSKEAAEHWQGIWGHPIHIYPRPKRAGEQSEGVSDREYENYVRGMIYKNSIEGMAEERERRREEARQEHEAMKARARARAKQEKMQPKVNLRDQAEKKKMQWAGKWDGYNDEWKELDEGRSKLSMDTIPWPVSSRIYEDVSKSNVLRFFERAPEMDFWDGRDPTKDELRLVLKDARLRWHTDSIQRRFGGLAIDKKVIDAVTEVSQIVIDLLGEASDKR